MSRSSGSGLGFRAQGVGLGARKDVGFSRSGAGR